MGIAQYAIQMGHVIPTDVQVLILVVERQTRHLHLRVNKCTIVTRRQVPAQQPVQPMSPPVHILPVEHHPLHVLKILHHMLPAQREYATPQRLHVMLHVIRPHQLFPQTPV